MKINQNPHPKKVAVTLGHGSPALLRFDAEEQTH
jgi:hypothetical protein